LGFCLHGQNQAVAPSILLVKAMERQEFQCEALELQEKQDTLTVIILLPDNFGIKRE
jgi:hypothetical protein